MANDRNTLATAKKFRRSNSTVHKIKKDDDWERRAAAIGEKIKAGVDRKITAQEISNVRLVDACFRREVQAYLKKPKSKITGSPQNIVMMANYLDEAKGNLPQEPGGGVVPEQLSKALQILESLTPDDMKLLGDGIAKTRKLVEGNAG
jgi:hypothetical protein